MVPFGDLGYEEQIKDAVFVALCEIARQWIEDRCPVAGCVNPAQPPEKWASCFYDGSPCQAQDARHLGGGGV
jgi:hypothetical protein